MSELSVSDIQMGETYRVVIDQRGSEYWVEIEMDTGMSPTTNTAVGNVRESNYPNGAWEGEQFRIHSDGVVDRHRDPFGNIGEIVSITEIESE